MGRRPCCSKEGLNRGAWSAREDNILVDYIRTHGEGKWRDLPKRAGLKRCGKSCRLRWLNYLRPDIKRGNITHDEEDLIIKLHALLGNRWSLIAGRLPGRTDNEIKNYWNTNLSKKTTPPLCIKGSSKGKEEKKVGSSEEVKAAGEQLPAHVIQTKAVRCTKVYLPSPRDDPLTTGPSSDLTHGESPSSSVPRDADPASFLEEFDMDEFMSSFQEDGLLQLCVDEAREDANFAREDADDDSLWFCDPPMRMDLSNGNSCTESQVAAEVERLTYLIDCEEEEAQDK